MVYNLALLMLWPEVRAELKSVGDVYKVEVHVDERCER